MTPDDRGDDRSDDRKAPLERAVELAVYAPLGFVMTARDVLPPLVDQFVARGKAQYEQLRLIGQFAVAQGTQQLRQEVENRLRRQAGPDEVEPPSRVEAAVGREVAHSGNGAAARAQAARARAATLPIPDYDELSASQVVARLAGLTGDELAAVREYEESQRQRKTILTRIEQLTASR